VQQQIRRTGARYPQLLSYTILNVDDDDAARYAKRRTLERAGYRVVKASTGAEGLRLLSAIKPQLVLLDIKLPEMSGLDVCRIIKADPSTCDILICRFQLRELRPMTPCSG
jgi:CheY-like chemotaxis protein